jgi:ribosome maturation factor RimP
LADIAGLHRIIESEVQHLGYELVRVCMIGGSTDPTLQVMAERPDTRQLDLGDCERISRRLSDMLDLCDPIDGSYRLEVSSPGIDRPLTRLKDYRDWAGHQVRITLDEPIEGERKQFSGVLQGVEAKSVKLTDKTGAPHVLPFSDIASAKLVLTDKLIQATAPLNTQGADQIETVEE